ncbi:c-type cytochrome [Burkholderia stabilis]
MIRFIVGMIAAGACCAVFAGAVQAAHDAGRDVFAARCAVCHQAGGRGMDGLAPPLTTYPARYAALAEGRAQLVQTVLDGMFGDVTVDGKHYNFRMPSFAALSDTEIADVLNHVVFDLAAKPPGRVAPISASDVRAQRARPLDGAQVRERRAALLRMLGP